MANPSMHSLLFLTDRSRYDTGNRCKAQRYLNYHAGPYGNGYDRAAKDVPLATGGSIHAGLATILQGVKATDTLPEPMGVDAGVAQARHYYQTLVESRGLDYWGDDLEYQRLIREQHLLIEGLVRAWTLWQLPEVLRDWKIHTVEEEHLAVFDCTCGIGDFLGTQADHDSRGCQGIGIMCRADFTAQHRRSGVYSYHEFKSCSEAGYRWQEEWATDLQPYLGTLGVEQTLGITVDQIFIHGLVKGKRQKEYVKGQGYVGPEYQDSRLVCAWQNGQNLEEWAAKYKWVDETGTNRQLPKSFIKQPVDLFGSYTEYLESFAGDLKDQVLCTLGPFPRKDDLRERALRGWIAEERRVRAALWDVGDVAEACGGDLSNHDLQVALDTHFPRSYRCTPFGRKYRCKFVPHCHQEPGWENLGLQGFIDRRPHHDPELEQLKARGLEPPMMPTEPDED